MEDTTVLIVGAGPTGLSLALYLGQMKIKTIILEKQVEVIEDPRGISIAGDAVRVTYQLGIGDALFNTFGSEIGTLHFHNKTFHSPPFMGFDTRSDHLQQSVSNAIVQFQPDYERALRKALECLPSCELRLGCEVLSRAENDEGVIVTYSDNDDNTKQVRASWLIGADGKCGIVRKKFLEPEGIFQKVGLYNHVSTWVAANFETQLPTPATHPEFPLWKLGYSPQDVHELFWPHGLHFCNDVKRPTVSGRFGPVGRQLWRHEYSIEAGDHLDDPVAHLWTQFGPWLEIPGSKISKQLDGLTVTFPRDCIQITRCRPFTFSTKVVNRWFCRRTLLIGDAAHVFPPFGGQGIASGIRDAQALAWRLSILSQNKMPTFVQERVLTGWANERRQSCDHATRATRVNGMVTNMRSATLAFLFQSLMRLIWCVPDLVRILTRNTMGDTFRYQTAPGVFALHTKGGGRKLPQCWVRVARLSLVVIVRNNEEVDELAVEKMVEKASLPAGILTVESIIFLRIGNEELDSENWRTFQHQYRLCSKDELLSEGICPVDGYDEKTIERRIGRAAKYLILRPDFYIHSIAIDEKDFLANAQTIAEYFTLE
ncbi:3-(3-hydroxy-phenyl)propionate/3-hydroxycinnamic acid hydroxylase [Lachnellula subtilissima]|uniref:3-(3-hydroxy-phenyl)propionate/3-hydroxycinnamic acid hydroxylase n=1 Tax=Lachnellula subtilissima TaxID=602034 RepID=A0A8H8RZW3_9HELO|nr:3-(3-hydroxy-phenyl)propionate/3-hydroxycinnamic acid hydroxylase [Lachnellula subtilissima]